MMNDEGRFIIGIGAIIEHNKTGKILFLRRSPQSDYSPNIWDDVGGRMRQFERAEETLQREIVEETGITEITIIKPLVVSHYFRGEKITENEMIVITYWCKTAIEKVRLSKEHDSFKWFTPDRALSLINDTALKRNITRFIEERNLG
ncbi:MAG: NUDIX domain-containing protein [Candidatus Hodarchaeota archaeon]